MITSAFVFKNWA